MRLTSPKKLLKHKILEDPAQGYTSSNNGLGEKILWPVVCLQDFLSFMFCVF